MKIYVDEKLVAEIPEDKATIKFEMEDKNEVEMDASSFAWLMTEAELPTFFSNANKIGNSIEKWR